MTAGLEHFTYAQLRRGGLDDAAIRSQLRDGTLTRIRHGVYAVPRGLDPESRHLQLIRAVMTRVDPTNVLSHQSAGVLHGLPVQRDDLGVVAMTRRTAGHARAGATLRVHGSPLSDAEVTSVDGLVVTSLARTAFDLARTLEYPRAVAVVDAALSDGLDRAELLQVIGANKGLHGRAGARLAAEFGDGRAESPAESISRVQFSRFGVPDPVLQFTVAGGDGRAVARTDFAWPDLRLVGEIDGKWKYGALLRAGQTPEDAIMQEKRREELIREAGYWIVRWDWELMLDGAGLARRVLRAMEFQRRLLGV